jgi:hypothetical protein
MYGGYSIIIVLSTIFNVVMTKYIQIPHAYAWIVTLLWTGIVNYFILKKIWSFGGNTTTTTTNTNAKTTTMKKSSSEEQELFPLTNRSSPQNSIDNIA